jgi:type II secretory ATPase GspE/PulE/Tfp pilus assembly ATPase PilB-like protein
MCYPPDATLPGTNPLKLTMGTCQFLSATDPFQDAAPFAVPKGVMNERRTAEAASAKPALRFLAVVSMLLIIAASALADTVTLRSGKAMQGQVVEEQPTYIMFNDPLMGKVRLEKSTIVDIKRESAQATAPATGVSAVAAGHRQAGRFQEALDALLKGAQTNPAEASSIADEFQRCVFALLSRAQGARKTNPEAARLDYRTIYMAFVNPGAAGLMGGAGNYEKILNKVREELSATDAEFAGTLQSQPSLRTQARDLLFEAVTVNPANNDYQLALANTARELGDWKTAHQAYLAVTNSPNASDEVKMRANDGLVRVETGSKGVYKKPTPTPVATVPIAVVTATPATSIPRPVVALTPTPVPTPVGPRWKQILYQVQNSGVWGSLKELPGKLMSGDILPFVIGIPLVILVGWVLPYQFFKFRAHRGDIFAANYLFPARKFGLAMLFPYFFSVAKQPSAKNRCPFCNKGIDNIESYSDLNFFTCPHCRENITPIYDMKDYVDHLMEQLLAAQKRNKKGGSGESTLERDAMLKLVRGVLTLTVRRRASDFHLESENEGGKIRARIDGIMYELMSLPRELTPAFISAMKVMANLDITERRVPQDGKIAMWIDKQDIDLRINTSPSTMGEKVVIRILNQKSISVDPTKLGLDGENLQKYERAIHKPHGLIIVTGPSGSGKSTTLYVALNELNTGDKNMVTIEDPIEYHLKGLSQMQVNPAANFTFATGLRSILRQDPDVIMVGEIRDKETAEAALDAATTGHLVLTTLHTIDAPSAFGRLADLGVETRRIAPAINAVIAQRLIRTICPDCKKTYKPKKQDLEMLGVEGKDITYVHGAGCENCLNTGYFGRIAIYEFLTPDDSLKEMLDAGAAPSVIKEIARKSGYRTMREEGILKIMQGITTPEEVLRMTT